MKKPLLVSIVAAGALLFTILPQAHADDDWGAAILGFALGAGLGSSATIVYGAPPPVVYAPPPAVVYGPPAVIYAPSPRVYYYGRYRRHWQRHPHWRHHGWWRGRWHRDRDDD